MAKRPWITSCTWWNRGRRRTSSKEETDVVKSYQLGVNSYVVKPVDFSEFVSVVKHLGKFWAVINHLPHGYSRVAYCKDTEDQRI
jgi:response regulator RpfG family c-di-GMP phosphodiesterase